VLEKKLDLKNLSYEKIYDEKIHDEKEIVNFPVLELDNGELLNFSEAIKWVNSKEVQI
jgi:hypothetical protein